MDETQKGKITYFLNDKVMSGAVKSVLLAAFLKKRPETDVQYLAASMLAVQFLEDAMVELARYRNDTNDDAPKRVQNGL